jgi:hypothetical protein
MGKGSSDSFTSEETINTGIKFQGRERFEKGGNNVTGDHFNTSICDNQLYILGGSSHTGGFGAARGIVLSIKSEWYPGYGTFKNKNMKVDDNEVLILWNGTMSQSYGINLDLSVATHGFSCSNNTVSCTGNTQGNHFNAGIRIHHQLDQVGIEVEPDSDNTLQPLFGNGTWVLGWQSGSQGIDLTNIWGVAIPGDVNVDLQLIGWRNMSVCGNTVYGNCETAITSFGTPIETGALAFLPVNYAGSTAIPPSNIDTRRMTIMPCIGFTFQNNVITSHEPNYLEGFLANYKVGVNINWTSVDSHPAGLHNVEAGTSYLFGGWNISNNTSRLYTTTDNALNTGIGPLVPGAIQGYDVYLNQGGYTINGSATGIMRGVVCGQNYCAMFDGANRYGWVVQAGGWCPPIGGSLENLNDNPYFIK